GRERRPHPCGRGRGADRREGAGGPDPHRRDPERRGRRRGAPRPAPPRGRRAGRAGPGDQPPVGHARGGAGRGHARVRRRRADRGAVARDPRARRGGDRGGERRRAHRPRADQGEDSSGSAAVLSKALRTPAVRPAGGDGDLMAATPLSRRASEFLGVALFAAALIWLISLASYSASDPVWFFNTGSDLPPANFAGRIGAFIGELSYQMLGYSAYLVPLVLVVLGWHYFWCRAMDGGYAKVLGVGVVCGCISSFLSLAFGSLDVGGKEFRAGGFVGDRLAALLAEYLNRTGSIILILTLLFAAIILSTQFSFGRLFATLWHIAVERWTAMQDARARRRDEKAREKQRQEVLKKHLAKDTKEAKETKITKDLPAPVVAGVKSADVAAQDPSPPTRSKTAAIVGAAAAALKAASSKPTPPIKKPATLTMKDAKEPSLPLPEPERAPAERRKGAFTLPPHALLDAPKGERKIDERELMDGARLLEDKCREFSVEGTVVQIHPGPVVTTYEFKPDAGVKYSKITSLADDLCLAMQAESVIIDRIP